MTETLLMLILTVAAFFFGGWFFFYLIRAYSGGRDRTDHDRYNGFNHTTGTPRR